MVKYIILEDIFAESGLVNTESLEMHGEKVTKLFTKMEQSRKKIHKECFSRKTLDLLYGPSSRKGPKQNVKRNELS